MWYVLILLYYVFYPLIRCLSISPSYLMYISPLSGIYTGTCILSNLPPANPDRVVQPATYSVLPRFGFNQSSNSSGVGVQGLCDATQSRTVTRHIPLFVVAVNQAPEIAFAADVDAAGEAVVGVVQAWLDAEVEVAAIVVTDTDHAEAPPILSSFGVPQQAPVTVSLSAAGGRLSLPRRPQGLALQEGQGKQDRRLVLRGPLDVVNVALAGLTYSCRRRDGCFAGYQDSLTVSVSDEGFSGRGGALTASRVISVVVSALEGWVGEEAEALAAADAEAVIAVAAVAAVAAAGVAAVAAAGAAVAPAAAATGAAAAQY
ncbi:hypothetical protein B484DRAFT_205116 [Ochromonadaceae sp. CCMP2298]|nr:hypothetical protein B484DRAFT_205116 [Ochromonadaceae sp. CCMP2298]